MICATCWPKRPRRAQATVSPALRADSAQEMIAARMALADLPLKQFLNEAVVPYEDDEVTRLIIDSHDAAGFAAISSLTVGGFRDWLLSDAATGETLAKIARGITPEMAAGVCKLMRNQDLILVAKKCAVTSAFRNTIGLTGRMSVRLQPNHPFDDARGITASILDGILLGIGRCLHRHQSGQRRPGCYRRPAAAARRYHRAIADSDAGLRAHACDHHARIDRAGRAG